MNAQDVADRLDLEKHPRSWRGDCPAYAYPRVFTLKRGKNDTPLLYCSNGCGRDALAHALEARLGPLWTPPSQPDGADVEAARARKQAAALRLWNGSTAAPGTPADRYLAGRGLPDLAHSPALQYRGDCQHPEGGRYPALVAHVVDVDAQPIGCHRTYVSLDGSGKAGVTPDKASLGPIWGGAVRLDAEISCIDDGASQLVVGEGIEPSASAGLLMGLPAWAALSAGNLAKGLVLPAGVNSVVIAADRDLQARNGSWPGQEAARTAAARWRAEGRTVRIALPDRHGDFNDVLRERARA